MILAELTVLSLAFHLYIQLEENLSVPSNILQPPGRLNKNHFSSVLCVDAGTAALVVIGVLEMHPVSSPVVWRLGPRT